MRAPRFTDQRRALFDAEAVLFVGDDKTEVPVFDVRTEKRVRPDDEVELALFQRGLDRALVSRSAARRGSRSEP